MMPISLPFINMAQNLLVNYTGAQFETSGTDNPQPDPKLQAGVARAIASLNIKKPLQVKTQQGVTVALDAGSQDVNHMVAMTQAQADSLGLAPGQDALLVPDQAEYDSAINAVQTAINECLDWWAIMRQGLDRAKAAPVVARALEKRARQRKADTIRQVAVYVMGKIQRKELNRFL